MKKLFCIGLITCFAYTSSASNSDIVEKDMALVLWQLVTTGLDSIHARMGDEYNKLRINLDMTHYASDHALKFLLDDRYDKFLNHINMKCNAQDIDLIHQILGKYTPDIIRLIHDALQKPIPKYSDTQISQVLVSASEAFWEGMKKSGQMDIYQHAIDTQNYEVAIQSIKESYKVSSQELGQFLFVAAFIGLAWQESVYKDTGLKAKIDEISLAAQKVSDEISHSCQNFE